MSIFDFDDFLFATEEGVRQIKCGVQSYYTKSNLDGESYNVLVIRKKYKHVHFLEGICEQIFRVRLVLRRHELTFVSTGALRIEKYLLI